MKAATENPPRPTHLQLVTYIAIGVAIWIAGVVVVRLLGADFFEQGSGLLVAMFGVSIPLGMVTQYTIQRIIGVPMKDTLVPLMVMCATALLCDGFAIGFTDIYSGDVEIKVSVGGWLLWTFGWQIVITLLLTERANR